MQWASSIAIRVGLRSGEHLGEAGDAQSLGRDKEKLQCAVEVVAAGLTGLVAGEAGVDARHAQAECGQLGGLVVHQRNQRTDDERGSSAGDSGKLVAERLARSCRHDEQDVVAFGRSSADGFLVGAECGEAEGLMEQGGELHGPAQFRILFALGVVIGWMQATLRLTSCQCGKFCFQHWNRICLQRRLDGLGLR